MFVEVNRSSVIAVARSIFIFKRIMQRIIERCLIRLFGFIYGFILIKNGIIFFILATTETLPVVKYINSSNEAIFNIIKLTTVKHFTILDFK